MFVRVILILGCMGRRRVGHYGCMRELLLERIRLCVEVCVKDLVCYSMVTE